MAGDAEHSCCGVVQEAQERRRQRRAKPQPWIVLKLAVGLTVSIIGYTSYVYIGRFCVPMIRKNHGALGGRRIGSESCQALLRVNPLISWKTQYLFS